MSLSSTDLELVDPESAEVQSAQLELADSPAVGRAGWDLYGGVGLFAAVLADILGPNVPVVSRRR